MRRYPTLANAGWDTGFTISTCSVAMHPEPRTFPLSGIRFVLPCRPFGIGVVAWLAAE
jgi:hypothetical protein